MSKTGKSKEITVNVKNRVGAAAEVLKAIADAKVNLSAFCGYGMHDEGYLCFIAEDYAAARKVLKKGKYQFKVNDVIYTEIGNKPGAMAALMEKLAAKNINVHYAYSTASVKKSALAVFNVEGPPAKALKAIS